MNDDSETNLKLELEARGERLRILRNMLGLTIVKFSELCKMGESTIRQWEQGRASGLTERGAAKVFAAIQATNIDCDANWLVYGEGEPPRFKESPAVIKKQTMPFLNPQSIAKENAAIKDEIEIFKKSGEHRIVTLVEDDAMEPFLYGGDYIGGISVSGDMIKQLLGQICIVKLKTSEKSFVRKLYKGQKHDTFRLYAINPNTTVAPIIENVSLESAAMICRLWRPVYEG